MGEGFCVRSCSTPYDSKDYDIGNLLFFRSTVLCLYELYMLINVSNLYQKYTSARYMSNCKTKNFFCKNIDLCKMSYSELIKQIHTRPFSLKCDFRFHNLITLIS